MWKEAASSFPDACTRHTQEMTATASCLLSATLFASRFFLSVLFIFHSNAADATLGQLLHYSSSLGRLNTPICYCFLYLSLFNQNKYWQVELY